MLVIRLFWTNIYETFIGKTLQQRYNLGEWSSAFIKFFSYFTVAFVVESLTLADSYYSAALSVVALALVTLLSSSLSKLLEFMTPLSSKTWYTEYAGILSFIVLFDYVTPDLLDYLWFWGTQKDTDFYQWMGSIYSKKGCRDFKKAFALKNHPDKVCDQSKICKGRAAERFDRGYSMIKKQCDLIAKSQNSWPIFFFHQFQIFMNYILAFLFGPWQ